VHPVNPRQTLMTAVRNISTSTESGLFAGRTIVRRVNPPFDIGCQAVTVFAILRLRRVVRTVRRVGAAIFPDWDKSQQTTWFDSVDGRVWSRTRGKPL
jgi:hypothetical protein